ncbi:nodulin MtN21 /EamA-like transporter family protein [Striga asiatica]|uniref:WAT1-related protein n=1 Tax=Striga asiatica TaxID=4170 RepID=A0A5A7P5N2_STRAF|nr:nodulin MtN21 /EamA-like transporter family protein [Striga asiatica]
MGLENYKPIVVLLGCQFVYAGVTLFGRAGILQGMSTRVFVVYRQCIAFLIMSPIAYFSRRGRKEHCLEWKSLWLIFLVSFIGQVLITLNQNLYYEGLALANSTVGSTLGNLMPAITFIMAYTLGLEKVNLRSLRSVAKIIGTVVCVCGAAVVYFCWQAPVAGPCKCSIPGSSFGNNTNVLNGRLTIGSGSIDTRTRYECLDIQFTGAMDLRLLCREQLIIVVVKVTIYDLFYVFGLRKQL